MHRLIHKIQRQKYSKQTSVINLFFVMAKENLQQLRQLIAQQAARMMAEDGISDFAYAKKNSNHL